MSLSRKAKIAALCLFAAFACKPDEKEVFGVFNSFEDCAHGNGAACDKVQEYCSNSDKVYKTVQYLRDKSKGKYFTDGKYSPFDDSTVVTAFAKGCKRYREQFKNPCDEIFTSSWRTIKDGAIVYKPASGGAVPVNVSKACTLRPHVRLDHN